MKPCNYGDKYPLIKWNWIIKRGKDQGKHNWLVVLTNLKNICQWVGLSHILWKITND
jgi:hypothetical protein